MKMKKNIRKHVEEDFKYEVLKILNSRYGLDPYQNELVTDDICKLHKEYETKLLKQLIDNFYAIEKKEVKDE